MFGSDCGLTTVMIFLQETLSPLFYNIEQFSALLTRALTRLLQVSDSSGDISLPDDLVFVPCLRLSSSPEDKLLDILSRLSRMYTNVMCIPTIKAITINGARMVSSSDVVAGGGEDVVTPVMVDESSNEEAVVVVISVRKVLCDARSVPVDVGVISVRKFSVDIRGVPDDGGVISVRNVLVDIRGVPLDGGVISVREVFVDVRGIPVDGVVISVRTVLVDVRGVPVDVGVISVRKVLGDGAGVSVDAIVDDPSQTVQLEPGKSTPTHTETST